MQGSCEQGESGVSGLEAKPEVRRGGRARASLHQTEYGVLPQVPQHVQAVYIRLQLVPGALLLCVESQRDTGGVRAGVGAHHVPHGGSDL